MREYLRKASIAVAVMVIAAMQWSCRDMNRGVALVGEEEETPIIRDIGFSPERIDFDTLPTDAQGRAEVRIDFYVRTSSDAAVMSASLTREQGGDPLSVIQLQTPDSTFSNGDKLWRGTLRPRLRREQQGDYLVVVAPFSRFGLSHSNGRGRFSLTAGTNFPPELISVTAPDTVVLPTASEGRKVFRITAAARDSNGVEDIREVLASRNDNPAITFSLFDDGDVNGASGDERRGDGLFTATLQVTSDNPVVTRTFSYQAIDRSAARSNIIQKSITFIRP